MQITGIKCQLLTELWSYILRLSSIINTPLSVCGCDSTTALDSFGCCYVLDLGKVYEVVPEYTANNPCGPTRFDTINDEGECETAFDEPPYGTILDYKRLAARLVIWKNAKIKLSGTNPSLDYEERNIYYSRQRKDLPQIVNDQCINPIYCPAENGLFECCAHGDDDGESTVGGPYTNCTINPENCDLECNQNWKPQIYKYGMSNCLLSYIEEGQGSKNVILSAYAECPEWWFMDEGHIESIEQEIIDNNPFALNRTLTIYAHFQIEWKPIKCKSFGGLVGSPCNGNGRINFLVGDCGDSYTQGLIDEEERQRAVRIKAAVGYSSTYCGFDLDKSCEKIYE
jgi:hypothetical protein